MSSLQRFSAKEVLHFRGALNSWKVTRFPTIQSGDGLMPLAEFMAVHSATLENVKNQRPFTWSIDELDIHLRTRNCLLDDLRKTIYDVLSVSQLKLLQIRGFALTSLDDLTQAFEKVAALPVEPIEVVAPVETDISTSELEAFLREAKRRIKAYGSEPTLRELVLRLVITYPEQAHLNSIMQLVSGTYEYDYAAGTPRAQISRVIKRLVQEGILEGPCKIPVKNQLTNTHQYYRLAKRQDRTDS